MEKMKMQSPNLTEQNIEKLATLFPGCVTEGTGEDGKLKKVVNFNLLRQLLSDSVIEGDEAYEFTWVGKKAAIVEAHRPIRKTLRPCPEESKDWDTSENLYIEGDNLEVLKLLQESYLGKVKLIYIDPPYNTGNDFIYRDDFAQTIEEFSEQIGQYDEEDNRLFKNTDSNGRFHSNWCTMMYSRLILARNLLRSDGAIFISIDDHEVDNLKKMCDEVFGAENFVSQIVWQKRTSPDMRTAFSTAHEYILLYIRVHSATQKALKTLHFPTKYAIITPESTPTDRNVSRRDLRCFRLLFAQVSTIPRTVTIQNCKEVFPWKLSNYYLKMREFKSLLLQKKWSSTSC